MNEESDWVAPLDVACTECSAVIGEHCVGRPQRLAHQHKVRKQQSREKAMEQERSIKMPLKKD